VLREGEAGARVADLCRKFGISDATYYNWKAKYAGIGVNPYDWTERVRRAWRGGALFS
jgi:transposase